MFKNKINLPPSYFHGLQKDTVFFRSVGNAGVLFPAALLQARTSKQANHLGQIFSFCFTPRQTAIRKRNFYLDVI